MFFAFLVIILPHPYNLEKIFPATSEGPHLYSNLYFACEKKAITWHRSRLHEIDENYRWQQAQLKLVNARNLALKQGVDPLSPNYPDILHFYESPSVKMRL